jgi:3',5'-cyclic AMP phosphodiesterase CpdA
MKPDPKAGFQFLAFGDQRALISNDWPALIGVLDTLTARHDRLLFLLDTGDIVDNGSYSDQYHLLADLLGKVRSVPYLAAVGNHEVVENQSETGRVNFARFLSSIGEPISPERLYYRKVVGGVRFLFLDSNDLVYREGSGVDSRAVERRAHAQMEWLVGELSDPAFGPSATTVVIMHHPFIQSSAKHRDQARGLWTYRYHGRSLPDLFADGGVDLVLVGHTHTYERFTITRSDGRGFHLVNLSGRPVPSFLWFGAEERRAEDIRGNETAWLYKNGWRGLEGWSVTQEEVMLKQEEADQCALFSVDPEGGITFEPYFLGQPHVQPPVRLLWGVPRK